MAEIIPTEHLKSKIELLRLRNKELKIVATNGCFDILHIGHIRSLQKAKSLGDFLIVGINSDSSVKSLKGNERPINTEKDRAEVLAAIACIDIVSIFNELTAENFLDTVKPDIYAKGSEYSLDNLPEAKIVQKHGGKIVLIPMVPNFSTTTIIGKVKEN